MYYICETCEGKKLEAKFKTIDEFKFHKSNYHGIDIPSDPFLTSIKKELASSPKLMHKAEPKMYEPTIHSSHFNEILDKMTPMEINEYDSYKTSFYSDFELSKHPTCYSIEEKSEIHYKDIEEKHKLIKLNTEIMKLREENKKLKEQLAFYENIEFTDIDGNPININKLNKSPTETSKNDEKSVDQDSDGELTVDI